MFFLSLLLLLAGCFYPYPLVRRFILSEGDFGLLSLCLSFALGIGGLTLWMLFVGLLPGKWLNLWTVMIFPAAASAVGMWRARSLSSPPFPSLRNSQLSLRVLLDASSPVTWLRLVIFGSLAVTLIHALYFPFAGDDELSRYAYWAQYIYRAGHIGAEVQGYPLLLPLGYVWAFLVRGGPPVGEPFAKIVSWLFAPALVGATYCLADLWAGKRAALVAAFTLAVTRLFVDWSPMGYVDIPTGVYYTLSAVVLTLWLRRGEARFALLGGAMMGLALWTKQAGFAVLVSGGLILGWGVIHNRRQRGPAGAVAIAAIFGLPWYVRNAVLGGLANAVPGPGAFYYGQAQPTLLNWIPFLSFARDFGYGVVPLYLLGLIGGVTALLRKNRQPHAGAAPSAVGHPPSAILFQLAFFLPYLILWWGWFSYDARFLLTILPFYAVLVGLSFERVTARLRLSLVPPLARFLVALLTVALFLSGVYWRLGGVYRTLTRPFATYDERALAIKPDVYSVAHYIRANIPPGARILSHDVRLAYYLPDYRVDSGYPATLAELADYDYFVFGSWSLNDVYPRLGMADNEIVRSLDNPAVFEFLFQGENGTINVYRIVRG